MATTLPPAPPPAGQPVATPSSGGAPPTPPQPPRNLKEPMPWGWRIGLIAFIILYFLAALIPVTEDRSYVKSLFNQTMVFIVIVWALWQMAKHDIMFGFFRPNQVAIIESGTKPIKLVGIPAEGDQLGEGCEVVPAGTAKQQKLWWPARRYGLFWLGLPWHRLAHFLLIHTRMNKRITDETKVENWIIVDGINDHAPERFLLSSSIHEFLVPGVELSAGYRANIIIQLEMRLRKPLIARYDRASSHPNAQGVYTVDFYGPVDDILNTAVGNAIRGMGYDREKFERRIEETLTVVKAQFPNAPQEQVMRMIQDALTSATNDVNETGWLAADKSPKGPVCEQIQKEVNLTAEGISGYEVRRVSVPRWDLTTKEQQELVQKREQARIRRDTKILEAAAENAEFDEAMIAARKRFPNADDEALIAMVTEVMVSKNISRIENLTTYAGKGANMAISTPQQPPRPKQPKKGGNKP